jgi:hypothetical protein
LEIWKAAYVEAPMVDQNDLMAHIPTTTLMVSPQPTNDLTASTSAWTQMMNEETDVSDGEFSIFIQYFMTSI